MDSQIKFNIADAEENNPSANSHKMPQSNWMNEMKDIELNEIS